jgi:leucyl aminopeptidase (aminopeptidase T)
MDDKLTQITRAQEDLFLRTAEKILKTSLAVKPHEKFLVITDEETYPIGRSFFEAGRRADAEACLALIRERTHHGEEPPAPAAAAWTACDAYIVPTKYSLTHTQARKAATEAGARGATMPGIVPDMFGAGALTADYSVVGRMSEKMGSTMDHVDKVRITSRAGTDLTFSIKGRIVERDTGILAKAGDFGNLPAGEAYVAPVEGTADGTLVIDGSIASIGMIKSRPARVTIKEGFATEFEGGEEARKWEKMLASVRKKEAYNVAEFGVGCNPKAKLIGIILEDEKVYGTIHIALGDNSTFGGKVEAGIHLDGMVRNPSLFLDDEPVIKNGAWLI